MAQITRIDKVNTLLKTIHTCKIKLFFSLQRHYFPTSQSNLKEMNGYSNKRAEHKHCVKLWTLNFIQKLSSRLT